MTLVTGPQWGVRFILEGPDGSEAVFNDSTSPNYAGVLIPEECSGLDSAEVRENLTDRTEQDGSIQGDQFYGKRPIVLTGEIPATSAIERNEMLARLKRASNAMRKDAALMWQPSGGENQFVKCRRQQPLRVTGNWLKKFQLSLVAADPRLYSTTLYTGTIEPAPASESGRSYEKAFDYEYGAATPSGTLFINNQGDGESPPIIRIYGPGINPVVYNITTGQQVNLTYTLNTVEEYLELDFFARTIKLNGESNRYSALNFASSDWWLLQPDINEVRIGYSSFSAGAKMEVFYRDAWI